MSTSDLERFADRIQDLFPRIRRALDAQEQRELTGLGVTPAQSNALIALAAAPGTRTMGELAWDLGLTEGASTRMVDRLVGMNLVRRLRDPSDRRVVRVRLSSYGRQVVDLILARRRSEFVRLGERMTEEERALLLRGLTALVRAMDQLGAPGAEAPPDDQEMI
ncbi:MAG: MarR family transcriptional regulator [Actinomycetia bacterium]|nr:MarR family transcriptional regulator [Actinomycetes bacterium]